MGLSATFRILGLSLWHTRIPGRRSELDLVDLLTAPYDALNWLTDLLFVAVNLALDYRSKLRILTTLDTNGYANIIESQPNTYTGIYRPHWEIGHIQIPLAKRSLFGFPTFESWCPRFADGVPEPDDEHDDLPESPRQFIITFVGTPSKRGQYGHMGMMDRKVSIDLIVELKLLTKAV